MIMAFHHYEFISMFTDIESVCLNDRTISMQHQRGGILPYTSMSKQLHYVDNYVHVKERVANRRDPIKNIQDKLRLFFHVIMLELKNKHQFGLYSPSMWQCTRWKQSQ